MNADQLYSQYSEELSACLGLNNSIINSIGFLFSFLRIFSKIQQVLTQMYSEQQALKRKQAKNTANGRDENETEAIIENIRSNLPKSDTLCSLNNSSFLNV